MKHLITAALTVAVLLAAPAPANAQALPSECRKGHIEGHPGTPDAGWVYCLSGTGEFRARIRCGNGQGERITRYGIWRNAGATGTNRRSIAPCSVDYPARVGRIHIDRRDR